MRSSTTNRGFETFDHTADIGIRAWGPDKKSVFDEIARAMMSVIVDLGTVKPAKSYPVEMNESSQDELLLAWLKELLFIFETKKFFGCKFQIDKLSGKKLSARVWGELLDRKRHLLYREVKAVTRHRFSFQKTKRGFEAVAILDI